MPRLNLSLEGQDDELISVMAFAAKKGLVAKAAYEKDVPIEPNKALRKRMPSKRKPRSAPFFTGQRVQVTRTLSSYSIEVGQAGEVTKVERAGKGHTIWVDFGEGEKRVPRSALRASRS